MSGPGRRAAGLAAAAVAAMTALVVAGCSTDSAGMPGMGHTSSPPGSAPAASVSADHNQADVTFAQMMIPHHAQAVRMSDLLLAKPGVDAELITMAQQIKAAQAPEIATMTGWLTAWGQPNAMPMADGSGHDQGMLDEEQVGQLSDAGTHDAQRLYLTGMIAHHQGAVAMAKTEIDSGRNPDAIALARSIVSTQTAEITTLQKILARTS